MRNATEKFGFAPRDVYRGVFELPETTRIHADTANQQNYPNLKALVELFFDNHQFHTPSHRVVAVYPRQTFFRDDIWRIDFKSPWIARKVMESMERKEAEHLQQLFDLLHGNPKSSCMAGWFSSGRLQVTTR